MIVTTHRTKAYGLYRAVGFREADGAEVEAMGLTAERAEEFARVRAATWERCAGCSRVNVPPMEARLSRRAVGATLCPCCRSASEGANADFELDYAGG